MQLYAGDEIAMGPGKAALLEAISAAGSISGAARALGMSYRRAWLLVDVMNRCFEKPLVVTVPGGGSKAGAQVSKEGAKALAAFRSLEADLDAASGGKGLIELTAMLRDEA